MAKRPDFLKYLTWFPEIVSDYLEPTADITPVTNGFASSLLSAEQRVALRSMNITLTEQAIQQANALLGVRNQVDFGTQISVALARFHAHFVSYDTLRSLSRDYDIVFPWSLEYGNLRQPFNQRLIRLPLAIAFPRTVDEVAYWVQFVREHNFSVSIRSGNNSYEGLSTLNDVVIDLTFLTLDGHKQFEIDAAGQTVTVASGVRLGVLYTELANAGFGLAGGQCPSVCVGGLVGTGGIGFSTRRYGWACDQLLRVKCVLADGSIVEASEQEHADLYRACKGAGAAGLCVMTILTLRIAPVAPILWYSVFCDVLGDPLANGPKVLEQWQHLVTAPAALSSTFSATAKPSASVSVHGWYRNENNDPGAKRTLRRILDELWLDHLPDVKATVVIKQLPLLLSDKQPGNSTIEAATTGALLVPMPMFNQWKLKSAFTFQMVTAEQLKPVFDYLKKGPSANPLAGVGYLNPWLMGGQSNSLPADGAAIPVRENAVMWVHVGAQWNDEPLGQQALDWVDGLWAALDGVVSDTHFYGCPDLQLGSQLSDPPNLSYVDKYWKSPTHDFVPFLVEVKTKYDPKDVFKFAQSIPLPTKSGSAWDWI